MGSDQEGCTTRILQFLTLWFKCRTSYEEVLHYDLENDPMSMLIKALIDKGFGVVQPDQVSMKKWVETKVVSEE